jgi:hypothetical protein
VPYRFHKDQINFTYFPEYEGNRLNIGASISFLRGIFMAVIEMAVSAMAGYLGSVLGKVTEGAAGEVGKQVYQAIVSKFTKDQDKLAQATLQQLAVKPSDSGLQRDLTTVLQQKMQDVGFAAELEGLVGQQTIANQAIQQTFNAPVAKVVNVQEMNGTISF